MSLEHLLSVFLGPYIYSVKEMFLNEFLCCQIGDETFIIAALMAMRHPKSIVLSGALTALVVMTVSGLFRSLLCLKSYLKITQKWMLLFFFQNLLSLNISGDCC